jgi:peptidyl-tRNA hydrolase
MIDTKDYVLGKFSKEEKKELESKIKIVVDVIDDFIRDLDFNLIMNKYN